jgi:23S rRNA (cytosine1962-C5)-methyltransferase
VPTIYRIRLKKPLERQLRAGHPWIYADAVVAPKGLPTGSVVEVATTDGRPIGRGLYDARSPIAVRMYTTDPKRPVDELLVRSRIEEALRMRRGAFDTQTTNAFRWVNGEGDLLPGVVVDVYREVAVVRFDGDAVRVLVDAVVAAVVELGRSLGIESIYERSRGGRGQVLFGTTPPSPVEILEHSVRFAVDVISGQKTGFFLDQRENRRLLRGWSRDAEVANLFAYTGGFSVQAALGGARRVSSIDSAPAAIEGAKANFVLNSLDPLEHEFACEDAFAWLARARDAGRRFDVLIVDPPSFAPSEKSLSRALAAYRDLNALALSVLKIDGLLAASSCSSHVTMEHFLGALRDAGTQARRRLRILEMRGQPADHPTLPVFSEGRYLKFVLMRASEVN